MAHPGESVEGITVPEGDPNALRASATQLQAVAGRMQDSSSRLIGLPGLMSSWAGPGSSAFAQLTGQQAGTLQSAASSVTLTALNVSNAADILADAQRDARRAIDRAREARREIDRAKRDITDAQGDQRDAQRRMDAAAAARFAAEHTPLVAGTGIDLLAIQAAESAYRIALGDLHEAEGRERRARRRLSVAEHDLHAAQRDGQDAADTAQASARGLQAALGAMPPAVLAMPGAPARAVIGAESGYRPPPPPRAVPISEREPPEDWPGPMKALFKLGRGEATAISGVWHMGSSAVQHPTHVPGAVYAVGKHAVEDPVGTAKAVVGYDELASGRYEDWLGQLGIGLLAGAAGGSLSRAARLRRIVGSPKLYQLGPNAPRWGEAFAGRRLDFSKPDLGARPGTTVTVPPVREQLAAQYPRGVRFTRAGHPVFTPYAIKRVRVDGLTGSMRHDGALANEKIGAPGYQPPEGYTWHHGEDGRTMELVPKDVHRWVAHTGGRAALPDQIRQVTLGGDFTFPERTVGAVGALGGAATAGPGGGR